MPTEFEISKVLITRLYKIATLHFLFLSGGVEIILFRKFTVTDIRLIVRDIFANGLKISICLSSSAFGQNSKKYSKYVTQV